MKVLAIIPARGGSKGVPGKNIMEIDGKPMIGYTIEAALESKLLSDVYVSSDDDKILSVAGTYKGIHLHKRSDALATDTSPVTDTIQAIKTLAEATGIFYDALMILQPTAPIRTAAYIDQAIGLMAKDAEINSVISVCAMDDVHPARMYWNKNDRLHSILSEYEQHRRQDIPPAYYRNGSIYLVRTQAFEKAKSVMVAPVAPLIMPSAWLLNIDAPRDIYVAAALIPAWKNGKI